MCGLAGFLSFSNNVPHEEWEPLLVRMGNAIRHRGPDDNGIWKEIDSGIGLVHRRLAILDLSPAGHQPMRSNSERYILVFNGEIYNHLEIRNELEKLKKSAPIRWRGHSDTETLLAGFDAWGIEDTLKKVVGMFAIAVWDKKKRELTLARDRLGEKPLYYGWQGNTLLFGSELKALKQHPDFVGEIDRNALALLMQHNYIPAPHSIYENIKKLVPGTYLTVSQKKSNAEAVYYWDARQVIANGIANPFSGTAEEAVQQLENKLKAAVAQQMVADVPLGAFLSGGIDSSTIVALMQAQSTRPVRTFTIGFNEKNFNEAEHAKAVAKHLGTDHTELYITSKKALEVIPSLPSIYCEPFSDSSQIPTFLVSQLARGHVTVSLSGDGGDELFGGYDRYFKAVHIHNKLAGLPRLGQRLLPPILRKLSPSIWNYLAAPASYLTNGRLKEIGNRVHLLADLLEHDSRSQLDLYRYLISHWKKPTELVLNSKELSGTVTWPVQENQIPQFLNQMMGSDMLNYLPEDILTKVDRAAMAVSLETRVPLLDHRVVEFAWTVPLACKIHNGEGKWPLKQLLYKYVPKKLMERPKMGFGVPIAAWLRNPLRAWGEELLSEQRLKNQGFFNPALVWEKWAEHQSGTYDWEHHLWTVLMFQAWMDEQ